MWSGTEGFYSSNYDQWTAYLNSLDQSNDLNSTSSSSNIPYSTIQSVFDQFLLAFPYSQYYWLKYIQISSSKYQQPHEIIYLLHRRATHAAPYSLSLWYGRLSYLVNWNQISNQSIEIIQTIFEAIEYLSGHPDGADVWRLILFNIQLYGSILQIFYCYWRGLTLPSPYSTMISDLFTQYIQQINFSIDITSQQISLETAPFPTTQEIPLVIIFYSAIDSYTQMKEARRQFYFQSPSCEFEKLIIRKSFEGGMVSQPELSIWHQYLSYEELLCESPETTALPGSLMPDTSLSSGDHLRECFLRELDCLMMCSRQQSENGLIKDRIEERRKYDRVTQLYERCLLVCASYSEFWKRYISWTLRLGQRHSGNRNVSLYTLYGQLLEDYHRDGRGNDVISTLYKQKIELLKEKKSNGEETSSSKFCGQSIDLELVTKTVEMKRIQGFHEEALNVLAEAYEIADNSKSRCVHSCNTLQILRSSYLSIHLSDHKRALRDLLQYSRSCTSNPSREERIKSGGYLCKSLLDYRQVYWDDSSLSIVKCCYDILIRHYDIQLYEIRREMKKKKNEELLQEEKVILHNRDQEVCVLLSSSLMMATYSQLTELPIGYEVDGDADMTSVQGLRIELNIISPSSGTLIGIRGVGVGPLAQIYSQFCQNLCGNAQYVLRSQALIETCTRHRQYQYHGNKEIRS